MSRPGPPRTDPPRTDPPHTDGQGRSPSPTDLESEILALLDRRRPGATICPSEVARAVGERDDRGDGWRDLMGPVRDAAWRLAEAGRVVITQGGRPVPREGLRGPIRIGRGQTGPAEE